jgi:hypothetical protein
MRKLLAAGALLSALAPSWLLAATYIPVVPVSGAARTQATAINDKNVITGAYFDGSQIAHGFAGTLAGDYQTFDFDGGTNTAPFGIDRVGDTVGAGFTTQADCSAKPFERMVSGKIKPIKKDGKKVGGAALGMNTPGDFVGFICEGSAPAAGYRGRKAEWTDAVTLPGVHLLTIPAGINIFGTIVGWTMDTDTKIRGFVLKDGNASVVTYPGASQTQLAGVNDDGLISGTQTTGAITHAFLYDLNSAQFTSIEPPGATTSVAGGLNSGGLTAVASDLGSFIYCPKKKANCPH